MDNEFKKPSILKSTRNSIKRKVQNFSHESDDAVVEPLLQKDKTEATKIVKNVQKLINDECTGNTEVDSTVSNINTSDVGDKIKLIQKEEKELPKLSTTECVFNIKSSLGTHSDIQKPSIISTNSGDNNKYEKLENSSSSTKYFIENITCNKYELPTIPKSSPYPGYKSSPLIFTTAKIHNDAIAKTKEPVILNTSPILSTLENKEIKVEHYTKSPLNKINKENINTPELSSKVETKINTSSEISNIDDLRVLDNLKYTQSECLNKIDLNTSITASVFDKQSSAQSNKMDLSAKPVVTPITSNTTTSKDSVVNLLNNKSINKKCSTNFELSSNGSQEKVPEKTKTDIIINEKEKCLSTNGKTQLQKFETKKARDCFTVDKKDINIAPIQNTNSLKQKDIIKPKTAENISKQQDLTKKEDIGSSSKDISKSCANSVITQDSVGKGIPKDTQSKKILSSKITQGKIDNSSKTPEKIKLVRQQKTVVEKLESSPKTSESIGTQRNERLPDKTSTLSSSACTSGKNVKEVIRKTPKTTTNSSVTNESNVANNKAMESNKNNKDKKVPKV